MERKIGEIFEYNGSWFQCCKREFGCMKCYFNGHGVEGCGNDEVGSCISSHRSDGKDVIFKKLEKVGEPYEKRVSDGTFSKFQRYRVYNSVILPKEPYIYCNFIDGTVEIEIKQTKEDMEENKLNLKPFDIQKAREGKLVCTRDGRKARIICFDVNCSNNQPIIALITEENGFESLYSFTSEGKWVKEDSVHDLMMLPEKKEGWVNIYRDIDNNTPYTENDNIYSSRDKAKESAKMLNMKTYIDTIKVEWEE